MTRSSGWTCTVEAIEVQGQPAGLIVQGLAARILLWLGSRRRQRRRCSTPGSTRRTALKAAGGLGLAMLLIADIGDFLLENVPQLLPTLERLEFRRLTYRRVFFPEEGTTPEEVARPHRARRRRRDERRRQCW